MMLLPARQRLAVLTVQTDRIAMLLANGSPRHARSLTFRFDPEPGWREPAHLGQALRAFLRQEKASVRTVDKMILPAGWVALRTLSLPPVDDDALLPDLIRTSSEELFAHRLDDLAIGYDAATGETETRVSVISVLRTRLDAVQTCLQAAGLRSGSAYPYATCLARAICPTDEPGVLVAHNSGAVEVAGFRDGRVTWLRGLQDSSDVSAQLRRAALAGAAEPGTKLFVVGANGLAEMAGEAFRQKPTVREITEDQSLSLLAEAQPRETLNLLAKTKAPSTLRPHLIRIAAASAVLLLLVGWGAIHWHSVLQRTRQAQATMQNIGAKTKSVQKLQALLKTTLAWRDDRQELLSAWRDIAGLFPDEGTIWLTHFERDDDGKITLAGQARTRQEVLRLQKTLHESDAFTDVEAHMIRLSTGSNPVESFSFSCRHKAGGPQ